MSQKEFQQILKKFNFLNLDIASSSATFWLSSKLSLIGPIKRNLLLDEGRSDLNSINPGSMYFFSYNPKTKNTLPFYDMFPLVFVLERVRGGFLGFNLHYLSPQNRAIFVNYLLEQSDSPLWYKSENAQLQLDYKKIIKNKKMLKYVFGTIKHYRFSQFVSKTILISPKDWKFFPFLPIDGFYNATREDVYRWAETK